MRTASYDLLVIGSGIAGLSFALKVAAHARVALVTKKARTDSNTNYAQGGIAAVTADGDDYELHIRDTLAAGAGLCHTEAVRQLVQEGPPRVRELMNWGVQFSTSDGYLSLGREGGHSRRRILHAADRTGREIERALLESLASYGNVDIIEDHLAVDLLLTQNDDGPHGCRGALVLDRKRNEPLQVTARATFLAAGGLGCVYKHTTNPDIATGDGIAMAWRAGAEIANLEFVQFHPTALYPARDQAVLISEAVRGEGAILRTMDGRPLMEGIHPDGSLATRDVVARAIATALKETKDPYVLLDLSSLTASRVRERFPNIVAQCATHGVELPHDPIPVVPAAHYACGGVRTDDTGLTSIPGLYAAGEVAFTGVHGANRLASNSLLEAVVYSHRAAQAVLQLLKRPQAEPAIKPIDAFSEDREQIVEAPGTKPLQQLRDEIRVTMWEAAGVLRSRSALQKAAVRLQEIREQLQRHQSTGSLDAHLYETRNMADVACLIVDCALWRRESRGLHHVVECPYRDNELFLRDTIVRRGVPEGAPTPVATG